MASFLIRSFAVLTKFTWNRSETSGVLCIACIWPWIDYNNLKLLQSTDDNVNLSNLSAFQLLLHLIFYILTKHAFREFVGVNILGEA